MNFIVQHRVRVSRAVGYAAFAITGIGAIVWPVPSVSAATSGARYLALIWAIMLIVGGATSAVGAAIDRWIGEYVGLLPLIATFMVYAIAIGAAGRSLSSVSACALLGGVTFILLARWRDVAYIRQEAARYQSERGDR